MDKDTKKQIFINTLNDYISFEKKKENQIKTYSEAFGKDFSEDFNCPELYNSLVSIVSLTTGLEIQFAKDWIKWFFEERIENGDSKVITSDHREWDCSKVDIFYDMLWETHKLYREELKKL